VRVRARAVYVVVGMLFISSIHYCVGACVQGIKPPTFAYPKEPHGQEAGIAVCSPPSNHVNLCTPAYIEVLEVYYSIYSFINFSKKKETMSQCLSLSLCCNYSGYIQIEKYRKLWR